MRNFLALALMAMCLCGAVAAFTATDNVLAGTWKGSYTGKWSGTMEMLFTESDGKLKGKVTVRPAADPGYTAEFKSLEMRERRLVGSFDDPSIEGGETKISAVIESDKIGGNWSLTSNNAEVAAGTFEATKQR